MNVLTRFFLVSLVAGSLVGASLGIVAFGVAFGGLAFAPTAGAIVAAGASLPALARGLADVRNARAALAALIRQDVARYRLARFRAVERLA